MASPPGSRRGRKGNSRRRDEVERGTVLRDFECLDEADAPALLRAVGLHEQVAIAFGQGLEPLPHPPGQPLATGVVPLRDLVRRPAL